VSDLELERKESMTRAEAAKRLSAFAQALGSDDELELDLGGTSLKLRVGDDVRAEFEVEVDGDEIEVEIELKWSTAAAKGGSPKAGTAGGRRGHGS
jgi:amphi-Trp domain-containing protein